MLWIAQMGIATPSLKGMIILDCWANKNDWKIISFSPQRNIFFLLLCKLVCADTKKKQMELDKRQKPVQLTDLHQNGKRYFSILWLISSSFGFQNLVSRVSGGTRTDQLLNLTHLTRFRFSSASQQREQNKPGHYRAAPNLNTTASTMWTTNLIALWKGLGLCVETTLFG